MARKHIVFIVDAYSTDAPEHEPLKFLVVRASKNFPTTQTVSAHFERQGWTVTGCSRAGQVDAILRTPGAPNAGRWYGEHKAATRS
jgi:hypothetical protein